MATIKFWQEMQRVVTIDGQDKLMIGKNSTGEAMYVNMEDINQFLSIVGTAVKPIPGGATEETAVVLQPNASGQTREMNNVTGWFKNPTGPAWEAPVDSINTNWWDGTTWSLGSSNSLPVIPVADEVVELGAEATSQDAVFQFVKPIDDKISSIVEYSSIPSNPVLHKDVLSSAVGYGTSGIYGWGFPTKARQGLIDIGIKIVSAVGANQQRLIVREENRLGAVLLDKNFTHTITSTGVGALYEFNFNDTPIINPDNKKLWIELYANGAFGIYRVNPAQVFTTDDGFPPPGTSTTNNMGATQVGAGSVSAVYDIYHEVTTADITSDYVFTDSAKEQIQVIAGGGTEAVENNIPNENTRFCFTGSSVTWFDGFLQSGYVAEYIKWKQSQVANAILPNTFTTGVLETNRKHFLGQALRLTGVGQEIEFKITGNEVSIIQSMDRVNTNASEIELYIDGILYDTFNNFNTNPIGTETKVFTGDGSAVLFDLGRPFTYNQSVIVAGSSKIVTHNTNPSTGFVIPAGSDCAIIRKLGVDSNGNPAVTHWLWFKVAPTSGQNISITFNYGGKLTYEKTTVGETTNGTLECPYGDGDISFDPTAPSAIGSGLDFRETDERAVKIYRFTENKERTVKLRVKGLYPGATGTPYFVFNFATNRFFYFQNAGIGGWKIRDLDRMIADEPLRGWQRISQFNPDELVIETTPNDDWQVKGHKVYNTKEVGLTELRTIKNMPLRSITYNSGTDTYTFTKWKGIITALTETNVTFDGTVANPIVEGDMIMIGQYWSNNFDYIERIVSGVAGNTLSFDKPISKQDIIYNSLSDFVGKEITVRSYSIFKDEMSSILLKIRRTSDCNIYLLENPMPNVLYRELWGYPMLFDMIVKDLAKVFHLDYSSLRKWQLSQPKTILTINVNTAALDPYLNKRVIEFGANGQNLLATDVLLNGVSIYGKRAVVENGWAYTVNQTSTGAALNKQSGGAVNTGQVFNARKPRLVILDETLVSGTVTIKYSADVWSGDSTHLNVNGSKLYADFLKEI